MRHDAYLFFYSEQLAVEHAQLQQACDTKLEALKDSGHSMQGTSTSTLSVGGQVA